MRIAVTGHINITDATAMLVESAIREHLEARDIEIVGISCLARGVDSIFAKSVLKVGGTLEVVLPSANYREAEVRPDHEALFDALLREAATVLTMPFPTACRDAYVAANTTMLDSADELLAVWDGRPSPDRGGTADVVDDARSRGLPVMAIWPHGAERE